MAKVYFDAFNLGLKRGTGVATYSRNLVQTAKALGHRTGLLYGFPRVLPWDKLRREVAFFDDGGPGPSKFARMLQTLGGAPISITGAWPQRLKRSGTVITRPLEPNWVESDDLFTAFDVFERARLSFALTKQLTTVHFPQRPDLFHWTYPMPLKSNARANIYTLHDLVPVRLPYMTADWKTYYIRAMRKLVKKADHLVTVSEFSRQDIMRLFDVPADRITNTYQAVHIPQHILDRPQDVVADELHGLFGLEMKKYFLFFGSLEPKKNINRIVQAFLAARTDMPLVMVVGQSWHSEEETRILDQVLDEDRTFRRHPSRRRIRRYEYLPFRLVTSLIRGARAVVFPSLYEGFGLPVLEAMALGTPAITSNTSSLPEVAGDAALLVDPYDVDAIRRAIVTLAHDDDLCADLARRGSAQAQLFSAEAYRDRIAGLYKRFL